MVSPPQKAFGERVKEDVFSGGTSLILPVATPEIVSFQGSFLNIPDFARGDGLLRDMAVSMLDKGTRSHTKQELTEALEGIGAQLQFSADGVRIRISGRAMRKDLPTVLNIMAEQLREPLFPEPELDLLKGRYEASFRQSLTSTASLSSGTLSRRMYEIGHPNYVRDPRNEIKELQGIDASSLGSYFERNIALSDFRLAVVGDIAQEEVSASLNTAFTGMAGQETAAIPDWNRINPDPGREEVIIPDRDNIDVRIGHTVDLRSLDSGFLPLYIGIYILGGNFSARLMNVIRDQMGLTYGIHSSLLDVDVLHHGEWTTSVTLSRENVERGIAETTKLLRVFVADGVSAEELQEKKTTLTGSFKVGLSSTSAIAAALLRNAEKGRSPEFLDGFPDRVNNVSLAEVNQEVSEKLDSDRLWVVLAGSLADKP